MRYLYVVMLLAALSLPASAQQHQSSDRPTRLGPGPIGLPLPPIGLPAKPTTPKPSWLTPQVPWWERQAPPSWETKGPPAWERGRVARPVTPQLRQRRHRSPQVIYVMQPVAQPYPVYIEVPAPPAPAPPPPPPPPVVEEEPAPALPPYVPAPGSRTMYVIPGCYLGNVKPEPARLPAGCDIGRLQIHGEPR